MKIHKLKTWPGHFSALKRGIKQFEIRKNDRDFQVEDELLLEEFQPCEKLYTNRILHRKVTYIVRSEEMGLEPGYVIMSIEKI